jgi:trehalose-phosphatase
MQILRSDVDLPRFFAELSGAPKRLLILDYDGTLAPFRVERDQAFPYPGVREALTALQAGGETRVVLVSGRAVASLLPLVGLDPPPEIWGSHGWEHRMPDGRFTVQEPGASAKLGLLKAESIAGGEWAGHWERKPVSIAAHWRGLTAEDAGRLKARVAGVWPRLADAHGLELHAFDGGIELRVPGIDKGTAVTTLLEECGAGVMAAYLGDDRTDEDAFRVLAGSRLAGRGLAILVREELRPTAAAVWLRPPAELLDFFQRWIAACPRRTETEPRKSGS